MIDLDEVEPGEIEYVFKKYKELIMAVGKKYPGESRHDTALRYIKQAEGNWHPATVAVLH